MKEKWRQLDLPIPEGVDVEPVLDAHLHEQVIQVREVFRERQQQGVIDITDTFITAQKFVWQGIDYRVRRPEVWGELARGYLMVESGDIPLAVGLLDTVYQKRAERGELGQFKWLTRKLRLSDCPNGDDTRAWWHEVHNEEMAGSYEELYPTDPRIVMYERSPQDIQEILSELVVLEDWQILEDHRRAAFLTEPPIRGDDHFTDMLGNPWYSLSFNGDVGHSKKDNITKN